MKDMTITNIRISESEHCTSFRFDVPTKYLDFIDASVQEYESVYLYILGCADGEYFNLQIPCSSIDLYSDICIIALKHEYIIRVYKAPRECDWVDIEVTNDIQN